MRLAGAALVALIATLPSTGLAAPEDPAAAPDPSDVLRRERSLLDALDGYVFEARRAEAAVKSAETARGETEARATAAEAVLARARRDETEARTRLQATLRLAQASAPWGTTTSMLLGGADADAARRGVLLKRLLDRQSREVAALAAASDHAAVAEFSAGIERAGAWALAQAEREARARLESESRARRDLLDRLEKDRGLAARHAAELDASERDLAREISARLSDHAGAVDFARLKGKVRWPLSDARVAVPFGDIVHPTFKTVTPHPGLTLAYPGTHERNVRAVAFGRVAWVGRMRGFGSTVVLDHASGWYTVYAGLAEAAVTEGSVVREGALLGRVEAEAGEESVRLYFELRRGSDALDPAPFLAKRDAR